MSNRRLNVAKSPSPETLVMTWCMTSSDRATGILRGGSRGQRAASF